MKKMPFQPVVCARAAIFFVAIVSLYGCNPTLNWRDVRVGEDGLKVLLPCKPTEASREVPINGQAATLHLVGCEAGGATFTVARVELATPADALATAVVWPRVNEGTLKATKSAASARSLPGSDGPGQLVVAMGQAADSQALSSHAFYFSKGRYAYQAQILGEPKAAGDGPGVLATEAVKTFLGGIAFQ